MVEKLSSAQQRAVDWIQGHKAAELGALGTEIGKMLAELTVELADAKREAAHWHHAFDTVRDELQVVVSVAISKSAGSRLIITKADYLEVVKRNVELYCDSPDGSGTRVYALRKRTKKNPIGDAVKGALNGSIITPH